MKEEKVLKKQFEYIDKNKNKLYYSKGNLYVKKDTKPQKIGRYIPFTTSGIYMYQKHFNQAKNIEVTPMGERRVPILWNIFIRLEESDIICLISDLFDQYRISVKKAKKVGGVKQSKSNLDNDIEGLFYLPLDEMKKIAWKALKSKK